MISKIASIFTLLLFLPLASSHAKEDYQEVFDIVQNPSSDPDKYGYYIKKKFYTPENIEAGKAFFEMNCAVCHGSEADGSGIRAGTMKEAKPRMLTNLDWSLTRDDLRLLRSIKYGVPGTAMTPWGDLTSSLQRLQLVIFIRSLTQERVLKEKLSTDLYQSFEKNILAVEEERIREYPTLAELKTSYQKIKDQRTALIEAGTNSVEQSLKLYQNELETLSKLKKREAIDSLLIDLKNEIAKERDTYNEMGNSLLKVNQEDDFNKFLKLIEFNKNRFTITDNKLQAHFDEKNEQKIDQIRSQLLSSLDKQIQETQKQKTLLEGKISSSERNTELTAINAQIDLLTKTRSNLIANFQKNVLSRKHQLELYGALPQTPAKGSPFANPQ